MGTPVHGFRALGYRPCGVQNVPTAWNAGAATYSVYARSCVTGRRAGPRPSCRLKQRRGPKHLTRYLEVPRTEVAAALSIAKMLCQTIRFNITTHTVMRGPRLRRSTEVNAVKPVDKCQRLV